MKTGNRSSEGRGVAAATIAFVAMLMIGQTAPMEYVRDASMSADTVVYDTLEFSVEENSDAPVLDLFSTVSNADDCKMFVQGNDYLDNQHFTTPSNGMVSPDATMADIGLDYENPQDADADNSYEFRVRTHCPGNDITARNYFLNVTNVVFDITGSGTGTISEDAAAGTAVWAPTGMNDTTANCAISEGDSGSLFAINTTTCAITTAGAFDYDTTPSHTLNVTASTAGDLESDYHIVTVTVTDVNEAPTGHLEITGTLTEGETISADATGVSDEDGMNMTDAEYQWYRGGAAIAGETSSTYTLTNDDSLQSMQVSMTYNDTAGRSTMVMSNASAAVSDVDNNDPASTAIPNQAVLEDASTIIDVSGYFSDADPGASLTYAIAGASFATINATGVITAAPAQTDVGAHTANVTVQDDDGTETYQEFFLNVTNVNDAFELVGYTLGVAGGVHDGSALSPGYTATVETTYDAEITTTYSAAGSYDFSYVMESWFEGSYNGYAVNIAIDGVTECQTGGASLAYAIANFFCSFTLATGETASITYYDFGYGQPYGDLTVVHTSEPTTLTLDNSLLSDGDGMGTLAYQWYADGTAITGAMSSTYTPEANNLSLIGNTYSVEITQTDAFGTEESMTSSSSAALTLNPAGDLDGDGTTNDVDTDVDGDGTDNAADAFEFDEHAWADNDDDGKADTLHSSLNEVAYSASATDVCGHGSDYVVGSGTCTVTIATDGYATYTVNFPYSSSWTTLTLTDPSGSSSDIATYLGSGATITDQLNQAGDWTFSWTDDGSYDVLEIDATTYVQSGFQPATVTPYGTVLDTDDDNDGTPDDTDAFPFDDTEDTDADADGIGANTDDLENDECYSVDTDDDGYPDAGTAVAGCTSTLVEDSDDDGDGIANVDDCNVGNATQMFDTDGDSICNSVDDDDDGDGVADWYDDYPLDGDAQYNADGDAFNNTVDADDDNDGITDDLDPDTDGDGYNNTDQGDGIVDWAPGDPDEWVDTDGDGLGNNLDTDDDEDGVLDSADGCPTDGAASLDTDGDGLCDATLDDDDDNDGVLDVDDAFSLDPDADTDTDGDGKADSLNPNLPTEDDYTTVELVTFTNSGQAAYVETTIPSSAAYGTLTYGDTTSWTSEFGMDLFSGTIAGGYSLIGQYSHGDGDITLTPGDYIVQLTDSYGDGGGSATVTYSYVSGSQEAQSTPFGTLLDNDDDQDGTVDTEDAFPLDGTESLDTDGDGIGNNADTDDDEDGTADASDAFPLDSTEDTDTDGDTIGDNADSDDDGDGVDDVSEETGCELNADCDADGVNDGNDAFPLDATEDTDTDGDGIGDNADIDDDGDGVSDAYDWAPLNASEWRDFDGDGIGDSADTDDDGDLVADTEDAFPLDGSESADTDGDTVGDNTDMDDDNDGVDDYDSNGAQLDNCRTTVNANQANNDGDTTGDLCDDDDDNDGTDDTLDAFQMNDAASVDTDGDGMPDDFHQTNTTTVTACTLENTAGTESADCTATISTTGETLVYTLITANTWSSDLTVTALMPNGDIVTLADRDMDVLTTYTWTFNAVGTYVLTLTDFYSDGGDSAYSGIDLVNRINENLSASLTTPEASSGGLTLDTDDDGDGYSDADESAGCAGEQAYATYESSSDPLDASSTPDDMDADNICDGLDMDRDGDGDFNYDVDYDGSVNYLHGDSEDVFPDDPAEKDDNDNDGTGDNADTDDDNDMWTDELENTCSGSEADGYSNQYDDTSTPDDYDSDMDCNTFDVDDDNDGVNDGPDPHPLDECYWSDNDQDGIADYNNEGNCVAHMTSFESGATGGIYTDTDTSGAAHDLANNAGEAEVNYDAPASYTVASVCPEGGAGFYVYGSGSCTVTVPSGGYADIGVYWPYGIPYVTLTATSPSGVATTPTTGFTATEAGDWTFDWGADGTWATIALLANVYTPETPFELGYQASWAPSANSGSGLTDGDYVGVTDYTGEVGAYLDGRLGYQMSDTDGAMTLTLDAIDPTGLTAAVSYFLADTTYEDDDSLSIDFVGSLSTVSLLSASGVSATDAAGGDGMEALAGAWTTVSADISAAGTGSLVITFDSNAGTEALYLDNVYFTTSYVALDSDDDNDMRLDGYDWCPLDPTEQDDNDEDGICDDTDLDDDNDGVFDFNDEFPYDGTEQTDDDGDGIGDNADTDDDNDGTDDANDAFPNDPSETDDFDGDGIGDNADTDDDGDGVSDTEDIWPLDNTMSTDTDGDGTADFYLTPAPYSLMDFESGSLPTEGTWTSYSCSVGGGSAPVHPSVTCTNSTLYGPWTVTSSNSIAGTYSLDSGQNSNQYGTTSIMVQFETLGGTATWDWEVSSFFRDFASVYYDGLEVWADGVKIPASSLGSECANDVWCGEDSGSMSWDFGAGVHDLTFSFRSGTSGQGGTNQAWIDNLQLPMNGVSNQMDTDDDNDGILDGDDLMQYDPCVGLDNDGDGAYDEMVGVGGAGVDLDGMACDASAYDIDSNDDNDDWSDVDEVNCGTDPMDSTDFPGDFDGDLVCDPVDPDDDNDGVDDGNDAFPNDPYESSDLDGDSIGDNADNDDDGDGYLDGADAFPTDASEWIDSDMDGIGDNADTDDDGDGVADDLDAFPLDDSESVDSDGDGFGDNIDPDDDDDGVLDESDSFPNDSTEAVDTDGDGIGDVQDNDDDGDGVDDSSDAFPLDPSETTDFDGDGIGDNTDSDIDGDGYSNALDEFDYDSSEWGDVDGDGIGDNTDSDNDNDGVADELDAFPFDASETVDMDGDGVGDNADADDDGDSYNDDVDVFPADENEWLDTDGDGTGDNADSDDDGDGFSDANENDCGTDTLDDDDTPPDYDGDGICDALDPNVDINIDEAPSEEDLGFGAAVPGFPTALAALALVGAALVAGRRTEE